LFCFSSRRRHTRFSRDWSSDVLLFRSEVAITSLRVFQSLRCDPSKYKAPTQKWGAVHIENVTDATGTANAPIQQVTGGWCDGSEIGRASCRERVLVAVVAGWGVERDGV